MCHTGSPEADRKQKSIPEKGEDWMETPCGGEMLHCFSFSIDLEGKLLTAALMSSASLLGEDCCTKFS